MMITPDSLMSAGSTSAAAASVVTAAATSSELALAPDASSFALELPPPQAVVEATSRDPMLAAVIPFHLAHALVVLLLLVLMLLILVGCESGYGLSTSTGLEATIDPGAFGTHMGARSRSGRSGLARTRRKCTCPCTILGQTPSIVLSSSRDFTVTRP